MIKSVVFSCLLVAQTAALAATTPLPANFEPIILKPSDNWGRSPGQQVLNQMFNAQAKNPEGQAQSYGENLQQPDWINQPVAHAPEWPAAIGDATVLSLPQAQWLFQRLAQLTYIPFGFPTEGCYLRAYEMNRILFYNGIQAKKLFVSVTNEDDKLEIDHWVNKHKMDVSWGYHVATLVLVRDNKTQKLVSMIIDPSFETQPVTVAEWVAAMTRHKPKMKLKYTYADNNQFTLGTRLEGDPFAKQIFSKNIKEIRVLKNYQNLLEQIYK